MEQEHTSEKKESLPVARVVQNCGVHIIIVEDDRFLRDLIARRLRQEGFMVGEATNGKTGLEAIQKNPPEMILLDIILPDMNGYDMLEEMRKDESLSSIPVIVLSNLGQKEDMERAREFGAKDFLIKAKFTPAEIVAHVKNTLNKSYM